MLELDDEADLRSRPRPLLLVVIGPQGLVVGELEALEEASVELQAEFDVATCRAEAAPRLVKLTSWRRGVRLALLRGERVLGTFEPVTVHRRGLVAFARQR